MLFRTLRGAGARGLAGLFAEGPVRHPLVEIDRQTIERYAKRRRLEWADDPSNRSRAFARNRLRLDTLPALRRARPAIDDELISLVLKQPSGAGRSTRSIEAGRSYSADLGEGELSVTVAALGELDPESLAILWPALAARAGVVLDWRGTRRIAEFTTKGRVGGRIQLSGGWTVYRSRSAFELCRTRMWRPNGLVDRD